MYRAPGSVLGVAGAAGANMLNAGQAADARRLNATALSYQQFPTRMTYTPTVGPELMKKLAPNVTPTAIERMFNDGMRVTLLPSADYPAWVTPPSNMYLNVQELSKWSPYGITGVASHELQHVRDFQSPAWSLGKYPVGLSVLAQEATGIGLGGPVGMGDLRRYERTGRGETLSSKLQSGLEYRASMVGGGYPALGTPEQGYRSLNNMPNIQSRLRFAGFLKPTYTQNYAGLAGPYYQRQLSNQAMSYMDRSRWYPTINWLEHSVG